MDDVTTSGQAEMPDDTDLAPQDAAEPEAPSKTAETPSATPASAGETAALIELALKDLQSRRDALEQDIKALSQRKQQLESELKTSFAGQSDAIARRVKGFQEYLGGALQDLVQSVESLELVVQPMVVQPHRWTPRKQWPAGWRRRGPALQRHWRTPSSRMRSSFATA